MTSRALYTAAKQRSGLSARQLADRMGLSVRTLQGWESGRIRIPITELLVLWEALGIDPDGEEARRMGETRYQEELHRGRIG